MNSARMWLLRWRDISFSADAFVIGSIDMILCSILQLTDLRLLFDGSAKRRVGVGSDWRNLIDFILDFREGFIERVLHSHSFAVRLF